jgi:GalNAc-alpha-(1->4)-GalNAc-alpha-(1->3)-diNAcBac-PP-undecaprenol alpha-1,4-N-acetyl-D-galactosaminyltransferase
MNLVLIISSLGPGGAERVLTILAGHIAAAGHNVTLVTMTDGSADFYEVDARVRRVGLGQFPPSHSAVQGVVLKVRQSFRIRRFLRRQRPDVVLSFIDGMNFLVLTAAAGMRVRVVVSERTDPRHNEVDTLVRLLRPYLYRRARAVVMQTHGAAQWAVACVGANKVSVLPNPIAPEFQPRHAAAAGRHEGTFVAVGRLVEPKGFDLLITAFARIAQDIPGWSLRIVGDGPERTSLSTLALDLGVGDRVQMPGLTRDVQATLASAMFSCCPRALRVSRTLCWRHSPSDCPS